MSKVPIHASHVCEENKYAAVRTQHIILKCVIKVDLISDLFSWVNSQGTVAHERARAELLGLVVEEVLPEANLVVLISRDLVKSPKACFARQVHSQLSAQRI